MATEERIKINVVTDAAQDMAWIHTRGMAEFDRPDLEWFWSPLESCEKGARILRTLSRRLVEDVAGVEAGDTIKLPAEGMVLQLQEGTAHGDSGGNSVLRVQR